MDAQVESADGETEGAELIPERCLDSAAMSDAMSSAIETGYGNDGLIVSVPFWNGATCSYVHHLQVGVELATVRTHRKHNHRLFPKAEGSIRCVRSSETIETGCMVRLLYYGTTNSCNYGIDINPWTIAFDTA